MNVRVLIIYLIISVWLKIQYKIVQHENLDMATEISLFYEFEIIQSVEKR